MKKIAIIGAGIGGITAGYRLQKAGFDVTIYDKANFIGGRMKSLELDGFHLDVGAGILPGAYRETKALLKEAGLTGLMEEVKGNCVFLREDASYPIDMGKMMTDLMTSPLISFTSKLKLSRLGLDLARQYRNLTFDNLALAADSDTLTVADYCEKYLPTEVSDYLLGPFVRTMYLHSPRNASITELLWCMKNLTGQSFSLKGGMDILPRTLANSLDVQLNTVVTNVREIENGVEISIETEGGQRSEIADYCYIASDAATLDKLYGHSLTGRQRNYLQELKYCPDIVITFCLDKEPEIDAILIQVPEKIDPELAAIVLDHNKGKGRVPEGKGMVTCHFLDSWGRRLMDAPDEKIIEEATASVAKIVPEVTTDLIKVHIERWSAAATSAECGTFKALTGFMEDRDLKSRVLYGGDYMAVSSVNVSVAVANKIVDTIVAKAGSH